MLTFALLAPVMKSTISVPLAQAIYRFDSAFCHQESHRCIRIGSQPTALCSRCLGGHFGFLLASFLFTAQFSPGNRIRLALGILASVGVLDIILGAACQYDTGNLHRFVSGLFVGSGLGMLIFRFVTDIETAESC
jgi:uncharacterized membrane protein